MVDTSLDQRRVKISATVDRSLLNDVDAFVDEHPAFTRSRIFDEALRLWKARQVEMAFEAQYAGPASEQETREQEDWRHIRRAAARRMLTRDDPR